MKHRQRFLIILLAVFLIAAILVLRPAAFNETRYQEIVQQVSANDLLATQVFTLEDVVSDEDYLASIVGGAELYKESSQLVDDALELANIPPVQKELAQDIDQYVELRIEQFSLLEESVRENDFNKLNEFVLLGERIDALAIYQQGSLLKSIDRQTN